MGLEQFVGQFGGGGGGGGGHTPTIEQLTDASTVTPDSTKDGGFLLTVSQPTQFLNPTGSPSNFQTYKIRLKSTAVRALSYDTQYRGTADCPLPLFTSGNSLTDEMIFEENTNDNKWTLMGRNFGA